MPCAAQWRKGDCLSVGLRFMSESSTTTRPQHQKRYSSVIITQNDKTTPSTSESLRFLKLIFFTMLLITGNRSAPGLPNDAR